MLLEDRRVLESSARASALHIQKEELQLFTDNVRTLGAQSAFLAGLGWLPLDIDFKSNAQWSEPLEVAIFTSAALACSLHVINALICALTVIHAPTLAIRGPDGSMQRALAGLYEQRKTCLRLYISGLFFILLNGACLIGVHTHLAAAWIPACSVFALAFFVALYLTRTLSLRFKLPVEYRRVNHSSTPTGFPSPNASSSVPSSWPGRPSPTPAVTDLERPLCVQARMLNKVGSSSAHGAQAA